MSGKKLYKTKLCVLYQRGRCWRQSCSFAHGEAELRRNSGYFDDGRDDDSRDRFERRYSTQNRHSPERVNRTRHAAHGHSPLLTFGRRRKNKHVEGQKEFSGSLRVADGAEVQDKEGKVFSSGFRDIFGEQLKQVKFDIDLLVEQKFKLEAELEEKSQEADSLSSRTQDLEAQLSEEKELCKRIASRMKKFIKAQNNCTRLHDELKRSQVRLNKLVEELGSDAVQLHTNEEDFSINIVSDGETTANHMVNQGKQKRKDVASFANKKLQISIDAEDASRSADMAKKKDVLGEKTLTRRNIDINLSNGRKESEVGNKRKDSERMQFSEDKPKRRKDGSKGIAPSNKVKGFENNQLVPPTSMAAHAVDELEGEERDEMVKMVPAVSNDEAAFVSAGLPFALPPLPSYSQNNYDQYEGDDELVNVDEPEEELLEVDIV